MKKLLMFIFLGFLFMAMAGNNLMAQSLQKQPDGVTYEVVGTRYEWRGHSLCGYNDVSVPNQGKFKIETRYYRRFKDGKVVETWSKEVDCGWTGDCRDT